ncbi:mraW methylase family protein isoform X2 [Wolffia australiana]
MAVAKLRLFPHSLCGGFLGRRSCSSGGARANLSPAKKSLALVKRRTRSDSEFDLEAYAQVLVEQTNHSTENRAIEVDWDAAAHVPVMLGEVLQVFSQKHLRSFVDCTVGAGGHSSAMIRAHPELQFYLGLDVDPKALDMARVRIDATTDCSSMELSLRHGNFRSLKQILGTFELIESVDGILMDLGISSMQVNNPERGFSVLEDGPLDMRMNPHATLKAEDILNSWPEAEVGRILREYGEESNWRLLQKKIVSARLCGGLHSTKELADLVRSTCPPFKGRQGWIKTATRVFQALRIAVNDELESLKVTLDEAFDSLASGGRLAVISFHSLEDRIVKQSFLSIINNGEGLEKADLDVSESWSKARVLGRRGLVLTKRPITPSDEEVKVNPRCRSAKLRVVQKI